MPGTYDILLNKPGYLDCIYTMSKQIEENDVIEMGRRTLIPGDIDKNGIVNGADISAVKYYFRCYTTDNGVNADCDFNNDEYIDGGDLSYVKNYNSYIREIIKL